MSSRLSSPQWLSNPTGFAMFVCSEASSVRVRLRRLHLSIGIGDGVGRMQHAFGKCCWHVILPALDKVHDAGRAAHTALRYHANYVLHPH